MATKTWLKIEELFTEIRLKDPHPNYLYSFTVDDSRIHLENSGFDGSWRGQFSHTDINRIGSFRIQYNQLLILCSFLLFLYDKAK